MMKFFRKYNKHLLAVFMALLLVIWLGGTAFEDMMSSRNRDSVQGTAVGGDITESDVKIAEREAELLKSLSPRFDWTMWQDALLADAPASEDRMGFIDWVLLKREAQRMGVAVSPEQAKAMLEAGGLSTEEIRHLALRNNRNPDIYFQAVASYLSVENMLKIYLTAAVPPEADLRRLARDVLEQASIQAVVFPAASFADPEQTFSDEALKEQFEAYRTARDGGGLNFGYFIDPKVKLQYIRIDPSKIQPNLRGSEQSFDREAYEFWQANKTSPQFRFNAADIEELKKARDAEASSNGAADAGTNGAANADTNGPDLPKIGENYTEFRQARKKALEAVRLQTARAEAERILNRLQQVLREPWFAVERNAETGAKPAPEAVKADDYYAQIVGELPANMQYGDAVEVGTTDWVTANELADTTGLGQAGMVNDQNDFVPVTQLAYNVEGLAEAPDEMHREGSLFLSQWETFGQPLMGRDGAVYLFRVVGVERGHAPESMDVVRDEVVADLRLKAGMERAREAAESFAAEVGTQGLQAAWNSNEELKARVTPDRGGLIDPPPFARDASAFGLPKNVVQPLGAVTQEFMDTAFKLAAQGEESETAVVSLPDEAAVVAMHGVKLRPLYEEDYLARRDGLQQRIGQTQRAMLMGQWLSAKNIRERNKFEFSRRS